MGSLQEHKCFAVTVFLMSSTFQGWSVGLLLLSISFFNFFSSKGKRNFDAKFGNVKLDQNNLMWERHV